MDTSMMEDSVDNINVLFLASENGFSLIMFILM